MSVSTNVVPPLFADFVDDAAIFCAGDSEPRARSAYSAHEARAEAVAGHRRHRGAWYSPLVGRLLLPARGLDELRPYLRGGLPVGLVGELDRAVEMAGLAGTDVEVRQIETAVARRGEDPLPGLNKLLTLASALPGIDLYAEVPLAWGLLGALDAMGQARADGARIGAKFRIGGLAAELFPTPVELAAVICACRDRGLPFKVTAGVHRAMRQKDLETGFTHHGILNVLAAVVAAVAGAEVVTVAERLAATDPLSLVDVIAPYRSTQRPLWTGFGSWNVADTVRDLGALGLLTIESPT